MTIDERVAEQRRLIAEAIKQAKNEAPTERKPAYPVLVERPNRLVLETCQVCGATREKVSEPREKFPALRRRA